MLSATGQPQDKLLSVTSVRPPEESHSQGQKETGGCRGPGEGGWAVTVWWGQSLGFTR